MHYVLYHNICLPRCPLQVASLWRGWEKKTTCFVCQPFGSSCCHGWTQKVFASDSKGICIRLKRYSSDSRGICIKLKRYLHQTQQVFASDSTGICIRLRRYWHQTQKVFASDWTGICIRLKRYLHQTQKVLASDSEAICIRLKGTDIRLKRYWYWHETQKVLASDYLLSQSQKVLTSDYLLSQSRKVLTSDYLLSQSQKVLASGMVLVLALYSKGIYIRLKIYLHTDLKGICIKFWSPPPPPPSSLKQLDLNSLNILLWVYFVWWFCEQPLDQHSFHFLCLLFCAQLLNPHSLSPWCGIGCTTSVTSLYPGNGSACPGASLFLVMIPKLWVVCVWRHAGGGGVDWRGGYPGCLDLFMLHAWIQVHVSFRSCKQGYVITIIGNL